jgi:hypothetical protein
MEDNFRVLTLFPAIPSPKQTNLIDAPLPIVAFFQIRGTIFTGTQAQGSFFGDVALVPLIFSPKQTALFLAPFFFSAQF